MKRVAAADGLRSARHARQRRRLTPGGWIGAVAIGGPGARGDARRQQGVAEARGGEVADRERVVALEHDAGVDVVAVERRGDGGAEVQAGGEGDVGTRLRILPHYACATAAPTTSSTAPGPLRRRGCARTGGDLQPEYQ